MSHQFPNIQSFFHPESSEQRQNSVGASARAGDGFTEEEIEAARSPVLPQWVPQQEYEDAEIGSLVPGHRRVTFKGRVVNFYDQQTPSKMPQAAKGCFKVVLKDDTGGLMVTLPLSHKFLTVLCLLILTTSVG